jgi:hypothetical protein
MSQNPNNGRQVSAAGAVVIPPPHLWKHMHDEHGLVLLESECRDIAEAVDAVRNDPVEQPPGRGTPTPPSTF